MLRNPEIPFLFDKLPFVGHEAEAKRLIPMVYRNVFDTTRSMGKSFEIKNEVSGVFSQESFVAIRNETMYYDAHWLVRFDEIRDCRNIELQITNYAHATLEMGFRIPTEEVAPVFERDIKFRKPDEHNKIVVHPIGASVYFLNDLLGSIGDETRTEIIFERHKRNLNQNMIARYGFAKDLYAPDVPYSMPFKI